MIIENNDNASKKYLLQKNIWFSDNFMGSENGTLAQFGLLRLHCKKIYSNFSNIFVDKIVL